MIEGHAIVSGDGMIADASGRMPETLRSDADWTRFQAALDRATLVVLGRRGHEAHPNPGRLRLVVTGAVDGLDRDPADPAAWRWNPRTLDFEDVLAALAITDGTVAIVGGTRIFDLFLSRYDAFDLATIPALRLPGGLPCFASGSPETTLAAAGMIPSAPILLDRRTTLTRWTRQPVKAADDDT